MIHLFPNPVKRYQYNCEQQTAKRGPARMYEQWHPLGIVGIITAFNFPGAVWSWNALIAAVCGDAILFKPSSKTPLTAIAIQNIIAPVVDRFRGCGHSRAAVYIHPADHYPCRCQSKVLKDVKAGIPPD